MSRTLLVLRHAEAANPPATSDADRPLTAEGLRAAAAVAASLPAAPDVVLCSPALRTRQTWEQLRDAAGLQVEPTLEPALYDAALDDLLDLVRGLPEDARVPLVVGHNPGCSELVTHLGGDPVRMRPGTLVVLQAAGSWPDVVTRGATVAGVHPAGAR